MVEMVGKFAISNLKDASFYMGCHITPSREEETIKFHQHLYFETVVGRVYSYADRCYPRCPWRSTSLEEGRPPRQQRRGQKCEVFGIDKQGGHVVGYLRCPDRI